jgi:O-antigen ligase
MGALIALHAWLKNRHKYMLMGFILFTVVVVLTASKAGLITLVTGSFVLSVQWVYRYLNNWKVWLLTMLSFLLMGVLLWSNALLRMRFSSAWNSITSAEVVNNPSKDSTQARMIMWSSARSVISRNFWIGVGTGDGDMELQKENLNRNNTGVAKQKLNAHNQFLNTWVQLGVLSCLVLVAIFGSLGFYFYKKKSPISLLILFCFFINFLFESLLETRAGIVPFCFLTLLLLTIIRQESGDYTLSTE